MTLKMAPFQYSTVIQPDRDLIGGCYHESGRQQLCLDRRTLTTIARLSRFAEHKRVDSKKNQLSLSLELQHAD